MVHGQLRLLDHLGTLNSTPPPEAVWGEIFPHRPQTHIYILLSWATSSNETKLGTTGSTTPPPYDIGMKLGRQVATITYRSGLEWEIWQAEIG